MPVLALLLWPVRDLLRAHEAVVWGLLIGAVAFLGLAHAGAAILVGNSFLEGEIGTASSAAVVAAGLLLGLGFGWRASGRGAAVGAVSLALLPWFAVAYVALHTFTDGIVLGESYAGPGSTGYPLTAVIVGGTLLHRFAEGVLILIPAVWAGWKPSKTLAALLLPILALPAVYVPLGLLGPGVLSAGSVALEQSISVFTSSLEAGFAILFLLLGLLPRVAPAKDGRWAVAAGFAFTALMLVHFLVE